MKNKNMLALIVVAFVLVIGVIAAVFLLDPADKPPETQPSTTAPSEPTKPSEPEVTDPTDPTDPTEPVDPTDPTDPTEPVDPTEPTDPQPTEPQPTDPQPTEGTEPTEPQPTEPEPPVHEHSYTALVTAPTCTDKGYTTYTCSCGDSYTGTQVPATGHLWGKWTVVEPATEAAVGKEQRVCNGCGKKEEREIPKLEHKHSYTSKVTKEPTCTATGMEIFTCKCGDTYAKAIAKLEHQYIEKITPATCTENGKKVRTCSGCGTSQTETVFAQGHSWGDWELIKQPTETEEGSMNRTCSTCREVETKILHFGTHEHIYTDTVVEPTCTEEGYTLHTCYCGNSYKDNIVKKLKHDWVGTDVPPTCTEKGYHRMECKRCGEEDELYEGIMPLGHDYTPWNVTKAPTETERGHQERKCNRCGYENEEVILSLSEQREHFIDERVKIEYIGGGNYDYGYDNGKGEVACTDYRTWGDAPSIYILENGCMRVIYYTQTGEKIDHTIEPVDDYSVWMIIDEDGTFKITLVPDYTKG